VHRQSCARGGGLTDRVGGWIIRRDQQPDGLAPVRLATV